MSKYSVLFDSDRYHEVGPFRFPIYEDLTPGERIQAEALNKKESKSTYKSIKIAQKIAADRKISNKAALELLGKLGEPENEDLFFNYSDEIEALSTESLSPTEQKVAYVTLFMKYRGETRLPPSPKWTRTQDWTDADTAVIPGKILDGIFQLFLWERDGWPAEGNEEKAEEPPAES